MAEPYAYETWERIKCTWWFLGFKCILAFTVIHGFVWKWDRIISHCKLFPEPPKAALPAARHWLKLQELHFHCLCVCEVFDSASTEHCSCPVLPAHMSKISQRAEGRPRLDGSVTNYRLVCEIWVASPWPGSEGKAWCGLGAGARLPRSWQVLPPVPGSSVLLSGQFVVYKPNVPPWGYWKREDLFSTVSLMCGEVQSSTELWRKQNLCPAAWSLLLLRVERAVGSWYMRNQRLYGHKPKGFPSHSWFLFQIFPDFELLTFVAAWAMIFRVLLGVSRHKSLQNLFRELSWKAEMRMMHTGVMQ